MGIREFGGIHKVLRNILGLDGELEVVKEWKVEVGFGGPEHTAKE